MSTSSLAANPKAATLTLDVGGPCFGDRETLAAAAFGLVPTSSTRTRRAIIDRRIVPLSNHRRCGSRTLTALGRPVPSGTTECPQGRASSSPRRHISMAAAGKMVERVSDESAIDLLLARIELLAVIDSLRNYKP